jgi:Flp pilus assembly protein TadG
MKSYLTRVWKSDNGSATIEFVSLALPLFIPLFLFLNQYSHQSDLEGALKTLSREISRAVVTSENDEMGRAVAEEVFQKGGNALGLSVEIRKGSIEYIIECREIPCISPDNEVMVTISSEDLDHSVSAVEYVSPWS